jgi:hypothetical protein
LATQSQAIKDKFDIPAFIEFHNSGDTDTKIKVYHEKAGAAGLKFPVLLKSKVGAKSRYAHYFYVVKNEEGLREALSFEGYEEELLLAQAYLPHFEQVYKVYSIKDWFCEEIRLSLPDKVILSEDCFPFDS